MDDPSRRSRTPRLVREKLAAMSDPLRVALVSRLSRGPASAAELAAGREEKLQRVRYQLRRMREVGLVDVAGTTSRAGVKENLYSVDPAAFVLDEEEVAGLTPEEYNLTLAAFMRTMFRELSAVIRSEPNTEREDFILRLPMPLDPQGWSEASALLEEVTSEVINAGRDSLDRMSSSGGQPIETLATILLFTLSECVEEQRPIEQRTERGAE